MKQRRETIDLNGLWQVEESREADDMPSSYGHSVTIPGWVSFAQPPFPDAGVFASHDYQWNFMVFNKQEQGALSLPIDEEALADPVGISRQSRNYFWYRRTFQAPAAREHAFLLVRKAQFGSKIWVNGQAVGESYSCMTAGKYDITGAIRWADDNEVIIRVGAHPKVLPKEEAFINHDFEKESWMPGLWDTVELFCFDGPAVSMVKTAACIDPKQVTVEVTLANTAPLDVTLTLNHTARDKNGKILGSGSRTLTVPGADAPCSRAEEAAAVRAAVSGNTLIPVKAGTSVVTMVIDVPDAELWTPEHPVLYDLVTETDGDSCVTRIGIREFRFDTPTRSAYLNRKKIFLRGGLAAFGRLSEDSACGDLPWRDDWVRKALGERARSMNWNCIKLCIHAVPERWLQIADEEGMLLFSEFPLWTLRPNFFMGYTKDYVGPEMVRKEMRPWVLDQLNHPSIIYYNGCLETYLPWTTDVIKEVRRIDISNRPWTNSWNTPIDDDDPIEDHEYEYHTTGLPGYPVFDFASLESRGGFERQAHGEIPSSHPAVISEYGWLFLSRDGEPTPLTGRVYRDIDFPTDTPDERFKTHAYLHAGLTEYWRAFRHYAGIIQISYLSWSDPGKCSAGYLSDLENLEFHPYFEEYVKDAFSPLGVYLNFWHKEIKFGGKTKNWTDPDEQILWTMICNDDGGKRTGELVLTLEKEEEDNTPDAEGRIYHSGDIIELARTAFEVGPVGQRTIRSDVKVPHAPGKWTLKATLIKEDGTTVTSRRWVTLKERGKKAEESKMW